jgi:hypothetical protein
METVRDSWIEKSKTIFLSNLKVFKYELEYELEYELKYGLEWTIALAHG